MKAKWYHRFNPFIKMEELTLNNAGRWLADMLNQGYQSYTGKNVSVESSLSHTAVLSAVRLISESIASIPLELYKIVGEDERQKARGHPLYYILHNQPNPEMTAFSFWELAMFNLLLIDGNFYAEIEKNLRGEVISLHPLLSKKMDIKRINGEITYIYELPDSSKVHIPTDNIFHLHGLSSNGIKGMSPLAHAKEAIGLGLAAEEFGARFFGNGGSVSGVLESDLELGEEGRKNLRESFDETYKGLSKAHRLLILEEGLKYKQMGVPPDQAQFLETRKYQVTEVARIFRVPPHLLYDLDRSTNNNIEQQSLEYVKYTLLPWVTRIEQTISWKLLSQSDKKKYLPEFWMNGLLRGDLQSRFEAYHIARNDGIITDDEWRKFENWNPLTPEQRSKVWRPVNMVPGDTPAEHQMKAHHASGGGDNNAKK